MKNLWFLFLLLSSSHLLSAQSWKDYYEQTTTVDDTTFLVKRFGKYGIVDNQGKLVIDTKYDTLIPYPKGYAAQERDIDLVLSKKGKVLYNSTKALSFPPFDHPSWIDASTKIPLVKRVAGASSLSTYNSILPYKYLDIKPLSISNTLFLVQNKTKKWAVIDTSQRLLTSYIYETNSTNKDFHLEQAMEHKTPYFYSNNWVKRGDTIICLSSLSGQELWKTTNPINVLYCEKGIHLVTTRDSINKAQYIIDEVSNTSIRIQKPIKEIQHYLGNGIFYALLQDENYGTIDLYGNVQQNYDYQEIRPITPLKETYYLKKEHINFGDYLYAKNTQGIFLWSPSNNHRIKISNPTNQSLEDFNLLPICKSKRYWILIESNEKTLTYLKNGIWHTPTFYSKLIICDSISGKTIYSDTSNELKKGLRFEKSSPSNSIWFITNHQNKKNSFSIFMNGTWKDYEDTYCDKLSDDGRFYLLSHYNEHFKRQQDILDTRTRQCIKQNIYDVVYFGRKNKERFAIQQEPDGSIYLADLTLKKIKELPISINEITKVNIKSNVPFSLLKIGISSTYSNDDYSQYGIMDEDGEILVPLQQKDFIKGYYYNDTYGFLGRKRNRRSHISYIYNGVTKLDFDRSGYINLDQGLVVGTAKDSLCIINYQKGILSPRFENGTVLWVSKPSGIMLQHNKNKLYDVDFNPLESLPLKDLSLNNQQIVDFKANQYLITPHYYHARYDDKFVIIYKRILQYIDWEGNCIEECD